MFTRLDEVDDIAERVIACAIEVHRTMGTGLLESIYQECVTLECRKQGLQLELEQIVPVHYKGTKLLSRCEHPVPPSLKQIRFSDRRLMAGDLTPSTTSGRVAS